MAMALPGLLKISTPFMLTKPLLAFFLITYSIFSEEFQIIGPDYPHLGGGIIYEINWKSTLTDLEYLTISLHSSDNTLLQYVSPKHKNTSQHFWRVPTRYNLRNAFLRAHCYNSDNKSIGYFDSSKFTVNGSPPTNPVTILRWDDPLDATFYFSVIEPSKMNFFTQRRIFFSSEDKFDEVVFSYEVENQNKKSFMTLMDVSGELNFNLNLSDLNLNLEKPTKVNFLMYGTYQGNIYKRSEMSIFRPWPCQHCTYTE